MQYLFSTAYLPPIEYFSKLIESDDALIECFENYIKQTYRNRCYILGLEGTVMLTVPVLLGSFHKVNIKDIQIDYSRRWQQVHLGAIESAYRSSPYFIYYYDKLREIILSKRKFLIDLNTELLEALNGMAGIKTKISYTSVFQKPGENQWDFRYSLSPKKASEFRVRPYQTVFLCSPDIKGLSIIDLLFNCGPGLSAYLISG